MPGNYLDQFESLDDAKAAGPVLHGGCAKEYARRPGRPSTRVFMYHDRDAGALSTD